MQKHTSLATLLSFQPSVNGFSMICGTNELEFHFRLFIQICQKMSEKGKKIGKKPQAYFVFKYIRRTGSLCAICGPPGIHGWTGEIDKAKAFEFLPVMISLLSRPRYLSFLLTINHVPCCVLVGWSWNWGKINAKWLDPPILPHPSPVFCLLDSSKGLKSWVESHLSHPWIGFLKWNPTNEQEGGGFKSKLQCTIHLSRNLSIIGKKSSKICSLPRTGCETRFAKEYPGFKTLQAVKLASKMWLSIDRQSSALQSVRNAKWVQWAKWAQWAQESTVGTVGPSQDWAADNQSPMKRDNRDHRTLSSPVTSDICFKQSLLLPFLLWTLLQKNLSGTFVGRSQLAVLPTLECPSVSSSSTSCSRLRPNPPGGML